MQVLREIQERCNHLPALELVAQRLGLPLAQVRGVRAHRFELGAGLSPDTERASQAAWPRLLEPCRG